MQAASFSIVHILTGFDVNPTSSSALFGIDLHFALIPGIIMLIGTLIFWKFYKLTPDKVKDHQERVIELKI
ncbi:MAG: hypothetical protein EAX89_09885 [Candidatus Lokiarchaeota archaeon]|nr:hypothetical protein [Candidatus Lokiarchaeota archaeon]